MKRGVSKNLLRLCAGNTVLRNRVCAADSNNQSIFICDKALNKLTDKELKAYGKRR